MNKLKGFHFARVTLLVIVFLILGLLKWLVFGLSTTEKILIAVSVFLIFIGIVIVRKLEKQESLQESLAVDLKRPCLIQRCTLAEGKLGYDYMGDANFECGSRPESFRRIFTRGITVFSTMISVGENEIKFFLVAGKGFLFEQYQKHLSDLASGDHYTANPTYLVDVIEMKLGKRDGDRFLRFYKEINVWFDIENDVLFVLSEEDLEKLVRVLAKIEKDLKNLKKK